MVDTLLDPQPGERWHYPEGATTGNPAAKSVVIVARIDDARVEDPHIEGRPLRLVVFSRWFPRRGWVHEIDSVWLWEVVRGSWAKGPLQKGKP